MENNTRNSSIGFSGLLTIVFIVLKLCKVISWSWIWVLSPIWITLLIVVLRLTMAIILHIYIIAKKPNPINPYIEY